jgi:hypothetical protein
MDIKITTVFDPDIYPSTKKPLTLVWIRNYFVKSFVLAGMKSIMLAAGNLAAGRSKVAIAGGFESMSNVPFYMKRGDTPYGNP